MIRKRLNPKVDRALLALSETGADEERFLESIVEGERLKCVSETSGGKMSVETAKVRKLDNWLRRRLLRQCLSELSVDAVDREVIERLDRIVMSGEGGCSVAGGVQATVANGRLVLFRPAAKWEYEVPVNGDCLVQPAGVILKIRSHLRKPTRVGAAVRRQSRKVTVDLAKVSGRLIVRNIRPGDRFQPLGMRGTKKVGDYLTDRKLPAVFRDEIPVVCDDSGIMWLAGFEIAERVKIDTKTKEVLTLEIVRSKKSSIEAV